MRILVKKSAPNNLINTEEKNNNFLEISEYKENLEFEILETFSEIILFLKILKSAYFQFYASSSYKKF